MKKFFGIAAGLVACVAMGAVAFAAVVVDDAGKGFVGKGDVQSLFGWNNADLQTCVNSVDHDDYDEETDAGCLRFSFEVEAVTSEINSWLCEHDDNPNAADQEQNNTATVTISGGGIVATVARAKNQVSGFNLEGGEWSVSTTDTVTGHPTNHCQAANRSYKEGSTETTVIDLGSVRKLTITDMSTGKSHTIDLDEEE